MQVTPRVAREDSGKRDAALYLRSLGAAVHLLHENSKRPVGSSWASAPVLTDVQLSAVDFTHYNLGVRPGTWSPLAPGRYLGVVDFDITYHCTETERAEAYQALRRLMQGVEEVCPAVVSGSGGESRHFWVRLPGDLSTTVFSKSDRKVGDKHTWEVRLLFTGGNAVVPPSIHPDTLLPYQWAPGRAPWQVEIPELPETAWGALRAAKTVTEVGDMPALCDASLLPSLDSLRLPEDVLLFLREGQYIPGKDGNASVQRAANQLYRLGLSDSVALSLLAASVGGHEVAAKRRGEDAMAVADWLWKYACAKGKAYSPPEAEEVLPEVKAPPAAVPSFLSLAPAPPPAETPPALSAVPMLPTVKTFEDIMQEAALLGELDDPKPLLRDALHLGPIELDKLVHVVSAKCGVKIKAVEEQLKLLRPRGLASGEGETPDFYGQFCYIAEQNIFFDPNRRMLLSIEAFNNAHSHLDESPVAQALVHNRVQKVDRVDYRPGMPRFFTDCGISYCNGWHGIRDHGVEGDVARWLDHFDALGWVGAQKKHALQWMAFTLRHPERKINHILMLGGGEGNGKDFLLYPLTQAMADDAQVIDADELLADFNDYLLATKYLHLNEAELGSRSDAQSIANKLKRMAARPPETLRVNQKGIKPIKVQNLVNVSMSTNSRLPLKLGDNVRRYYGLWTSVSVFGPDGQMTPEWKEYWQDRWTWMRDQHGWRACVWFLENCVDLSDFDPGAVPAVTDFVKDIQDDSRSPLESLLRELIDQAQGVFSCDLVRSHDLHLALQANVALRDAYGLDKAPGVNKIATTLTHTGLAVSMTGRIEAGRGGSGRRNLLCIRNVGFYQNMNEADRYNTYLDQMQMALATPLTS